MKIDDRIKVLERAASVFSRAWLEAGLKLLLEEDFSSFLLFAWSES